MDTITGIPAHPLFVHIPVVLLPLAALLALVMLIRQTWFDRYKWALLAITSVGALGAILAAGSGESLEETVDKTGAARQALREHVEAGETARLLGIIFFAVIATWILVPMYLARRAHAAGSGDGTALGPPRQPTWLRPVIAVLVVLTAGAARDDHRRGPQRRQERLDRRGRRLSQTPSKLSRAFSTTSPSAGWM